MPPRVTNCVPGVTGVKKPRGSESGGGLSGTILPRRTGAQCRHRTPGFDRRAVCRPPCQWRRQAARHRHTSASPRLNAAPLARPRPDQGHGAGGYRAVPPRAARAGGSWQSHTTRHRPGRVRRDVQVRSVRERPGARRAVGGRTAYTGTSAHGQGHETTFAQIIADHLGRSPPRSSSVMVTRPPCKWAMARWSCPGLMDTWVKLPTVVVRAGAQRPAG
jgi:hypothetical protein